MCVIPEEIMNVFMKTMKIHYVLKGINENPETRITKKRSRQQFSRESCSENAKNVSEQWSSRTPVIATFQENPAARIKTAKMQKRPS